MSFKKLIAPCVMLMLLTPLAEAKNRKSKIPKNAKYTHVTGAKHFKYKSPKKQKLKHR